MLIDDDLQSLKGLSTALRFRGYESIQFQNPKEAIKAFKRDAYDIVVTDYNMPEMNGLEVMQAIQKISPETMVLVVTGYPEKCTSLIKKNRPQLLFEKPVNIEEFLEAIKKARNGSANQIEREC